MHPKPKHWFPFKLYIRPHALEKLYVSPDSTKNQPTQNKKSEISFRTFCYRVALSGIEPEFRASETLVLSIEL